MPVITKNQAVYSKDEILQLVRADASSKRLKVKKITFNPGSATVNVDLEDVSDNDSLGPSMMRGDEPFDSNKKKDQELIQSARANSGYGTRTEILLNKENDFS